MSEHLRSHITLPGLKTSMISAMLFLALSGCMSDYNKTLKKLQAESDSLDLENKKLDMEIAKDERSRHIQDSIDNVEQHKQDSILYAEKNKKISDMNFPTFKEPKIKSVTHNNCLIDGQLLPLHSLVEKLQKEAIQGKKFLYENSPEYILYKDSLMLFKIFDEKNNIGDKVKNNMNKNKIEYANAPFTPKEAKKLYEWFLRYADLRAKGIKQKRSSDVRDMVVKKEKRNDITLYYTDLDKRFPGVLAKHPSIQPIEYHYIRRAFAPYNTADYYSLVYKKPQQKITAIPQEIFSLYGINNPDDIKYIVETINNKNHFSEDSLSCSRVNDTDNLNTENTIPESPLSYTQYYKIKKNGKNILQIQDYDKFDNDQIKINTQPYTISNQPINVDLNHIMGNRVVIEIVNEGTLPPNTILLKLGSYSQRLEGKKGEIIVLEFEE